MSAAAPGIIRPDLATGDGMYKSTDAGKTWTHLGLRDSQMIANVEVDPRNPNRLFVAALGHPYGPNAERGIFRSTDGGATFEKVLYKDEYVSGNDVRIDPSDPEHRLCRALAATTELHRRRRVRRQHAVERRRHFQVHRRRLDVEAAGRRLAGRAPGEPRDRAEQPESRCTRRSRASDRARHPRRAPAAAQVPERAAGLVAGAAAVVAAIGFFKTTDGGDHWFLATDDPRVAEKQSTRIPADQRPLGRIGGGDLPTVTVDPKNENVVYSCSTVFWRTEDGGLTWSAVRGAPGGDDYQKSWINPDNPNILLVVADQGGVVSANRGESWSNWYTQPTAAMYHVTADNAFPYRLCGGQQDSGSACVDSRGNDGEITFHDWHPVNIQEYGIAAPDPKNPDLVFGSQRTGVSLYNRKTGQTAAVGPPPEVRGAFGRNVRTMPIVWSPIDSTVLFYAQNAVFKTIDQGHSWTRISPDLTRQTWAVPASVGKYASGVNPSPTGSITALAPSSRDVKVLWAGTDDGSIQVTIDGGLKWTDVTPPQIKPWTRIFNMDAGHFDTLTAYAAANTMRIDDMNPHLWRTHDGGKTWTEINNGIAPGAVANSIREDPRKKGVLYAGTDTQVWVSFDDGDHWSSLRLNMPAISVRDVQVKDDASCLCSDLVVGTHGRGFWILDNITPLRQQAELAAANGPYLYKPPTGIRVRFGMNDPTPWPPELPAGENPPPGAILDYYLPAAASGRSEARGSEHRGQGDSHLLEQRSGAQSGSGHRSSRVQQAVSGHADGGRLRSAALLARAAASALDASGPPSLHVGPALRPAGRGGGGRGGGAGGAVPHRTYPGVNSPWVAPGTYSVRLTADGKSSTQPITVKMDPRVKETLGVQQIYMLTTQAENGAMAAEAALKEAQAGAEKLRAKPQSAANDALLKEIDAIAPRKAAGAGGARWRVADSPRGWRSWRGAEVDVGSARCGRAAAGAPPAAAPETAAQTLASIGPALVAAIMPMQAAEMAPTAAQLKACTERQAEFAAVMAKWNALKLRLKAAGV